ncbi:hypothetical protein [Viridibacillus arvi]|uniref:hypothetical protein n=1 Tax=Viridibacillus arvi TaxID=263475 RepID=UPI0036EA0050
MKMMKYIVMIAVMVMISVCLNSTISHAEEVYETIPLNKTLSKTLLMDDNKEAGNMYQVKIPKDGVAKLQIESPKNKEFTLFLMSSLENVGILDPKVNSPIISYAISAKEANYNKSIMTDSVGVKKGTYYVFAYTEGNVEKVKFKVSFKAASNYEKENNNTIKTATPIKLGSTYKADIKMYDMKDYYKVTVPKKTKLQITVKKQLKAPFKIALQNSKKQTIKQLKMKTLNNTLTHTGKVTVDKGTYYVNVSSGVYFGTSSDYDKAPYTIKVNTTK